MATDPGYDAPRPKKSNTLWYVLGGVGVALLLFCCVCPAGWVGYFAWQDSTREKEVAKGASTKITADDLAKTYSDATHKNKVLEITGKVNPILLGVTEITTASSTKIICTPSSTEREKFQALKPGDTATITGYCTGKSGDAISMNNCHVVGK
jgi:hypothetical protein